MFTKRINIFTGHFGSGKTEVAVNYAIKLSEAFEKTAIVDFDIVNPYFRTADASTQLEEKGIWTVLPMYANTNVDVPALPAEMNTLFERKDYRIVLDVGGDDLGARAVSRYRDELLEDEYEMFFVINAKRPMTDTREKILYMLDTIEQSSRIKVTKLVNNTNLLEYTTIEDIYAGQKLIDGISADSGIPVGFVSGMESIFSGSSWSSDIPTLKMQKLIKLPWDK